MQTTFKINVDQAEIDKRKELLDQYQRFENPRMPAWLFMDAPFYCKAAGIGIDEIFRSPETMVTAQLTGWKKALEEVDCDNIAPNVGIDFGSPLTASTYGCEIVEKPGDFPQFNHWFASEADLPKLREMDTLAATLRKREIEFYNKLTSMADTVSYQCKNGAPIFPLKSVSFTTFSEGPFSIACMIAGMDTVSMWCLIEPELVRTMVEIITDKEIDRIKRQYALMGKPAQTVYMADDFSPYMPDDIYTDIILPSQIRLRDAFGDKVDFHSCIPDKRFLPLWRDSLRIRHFNGFKPQGGFSAILDNYSAVAQCMGNKVTMEPDIDGINTLNATEAEMAGAAKDVVQAFAGVRGVKLCATISGGHELGDLAKFNVLKRTVLGS